MKNPWVIIGVIAALLIGGSVWYSSTVGEANNEGITFSAHTKGSDTATVTLVEYSDFQCPACASFQPVLENALNDFGESIKFEYKHFPLPIHALAEPAARAAEAAGQQGAFFAFHDLLFANQATWSKSANPTAFFMQYAGELNLDMDKFKKHYSASMIRDRVKKEGAEARALGLSGTPTFFLNGERMQIETYEDFYNQLAVAVGATTTNAVAPAAAAPEVRFGI